MLQKFLDPETVACQVFSNKPNPEVLKKFIYSSQLETIFGGTAPKVERFWPPIMPKITETVNEKELNMVPRENYNAHYLQNPELTLMPRQLRMDLPELPCDAKEERIDSNPQEHGKSDSEEEKFWAKDADNQRPPEDLEATLGQKVNRTKSFASRKASIDSLNIMRFDADQIQQLNCSSYIDPKVRDDPYQTSLSKKCPTRHSIFSKTKEKIKSPFTQARKDAKKFSRSPNTVDLSHYPYTVDESEFRTQEKEFEKAPLIVTKGGYCGGSGWLRCKQ